jgi:hypothetical protein
MLAQLGQSERSVAEIQDGLAALATTGTDVGASAGLFILADAHHANGRDDDALAAVDAGLVFVESRGQGTWEAELHRVRGEIVLALGGDGARDDAERAFRRALDVARGQRATCFALRAATRLVRLRGDADARALLADALARTTEGRDTRDVADATALLREP